MDADTLFVNARIVDGSGNPWSYGDVAVAAGKIVAVTPPGQFPRETAGAIVDGIGLVLCPGFIDIQSHSLVPLLEDGRSVSKVAQGVTTEILGELWTPAPFGGRRKAAFGGWNNTAESGGAEVRWRTFAEWIEHYCRRGCAVNIGSFVGGATVREWACGWDAAPATREQVREMQAVVTRSMEEGAFGIAPALIYPPNSFSTDDELEACAETVGRYGGLYIVHLRSEGDGLLESIDATAALSERAKCAAEIYHLKASGERNWPKMPDAIARIDRHRAAGIDLAADMYPYVASGTGLNVLIPNWASEGGRLFDNLEDAATRKRIYEEMIAPKSATGDFASSDRGGHVMPVDLRRDEHKGFIGRRLTEIADALGLDWAEAAIQLLRSEGHRIGTVFFSMDEGNVALQLQQPWIKVSTDAGGIDPTQAVNPVHPRAYGTYPRVLGKYVRQERVLTLEDAVRKMTSSVADRLHLRDRGLVREGFCADLTLFDPATVADRATFAQPHELAVGIVGVWVNGVRVWGDGKVTGALPGQTVFGPGRR